MRKPTEQVTCRCGRVWTFTRAGAEDFASMAALCVPEWFKNATGEERYKRAQQRAGLPEAARWEKVLENQAQVKAVLDMMEKYCTDPLIVPASEEIDQNDMTHIHRGEVDHCCLNIVGPAIVEFTAKEAGIAAGFPDAGDGSQPGSDSAKVLDQSAQDRGIGGG